MKGQVTKFAFDNVRTTLDGQIIGTKPQSRFVRDPWTREEDAQLRASVEARGSTNWRDHAEQIGTKNAKQCRCRWHDHLNPTVNKGPWTITEIETMQTLHAKYGNKWSLIARALSGRTDNAVKNYFATSRNAQLLSETRARHRELAAPMDADTLNVPLNLFDALHEVGPMPHRFNFEELTDSDSLPSSTNTDGTLASALAAVRSNRVNIRTVPPKLIRARLPPAKARSRGFRVTIFDAMSISKRLGGINRMIGSKVPVCVRWRDSVKL
jgi:myb proto-oncogene protein